jgi:hypothetical protein
MPALAHTLNVDAPAVTSAARQTRVVAELGLAANRLPRAASRPSALVQSGQRAAARLGQICAEALTEWAAAPSPQ